MGNVTESIWDGQGAIIPLAEVSHIEKVKDSSFATDRIVVIFKHSKCNPETQELEPSVYLDSSRNSVGFIADWCRYRSELESDTLDDLSPQ
jgi:hypothetical protein